MISRRFHCVDEKIVTVEDDRILLYFNRLAHLATPEGRNDQMVRCLLISSDIFMQIVQWATKKKSETDAILAMGLDGSDLLSNWDKEFCLFNTENLAGIIHGAYYLQIPKLCQVCRDWISLITTKTNPAQLGVSSSDEGLDVIRGVAVVDATQEESNEARMCFLGGGFDNSSHATHDLIAQLNYNNQQLEANLNAKTAQYDFLKLMYEGLQVQNLEQSRKLSDATAEKINLERKLYDRSVGAPPKVFRQCLKCGSLLSSKDLLQKHMELVHKIT